MLPIFATALHPTPSSRRDTTQGTAVTQAESFGMRTFSIKHTAVQQYARHFFPMSFRYDTTIPRYNTMETTRLYVV